MAHRLTATVLACAAATLLVASVAFAAADEGRGMPPGPRSVPRWVPLAGLSLACVAAAATARTLPHVVWGRVAAGRVVRVLSAGTDGGETAAVRYTVGGREFEIRSLVAAGAAAGDEVRVLYLPADPGDGQVKGWRLYLIPFAFAAAVGLCVWVMAAG